MKHLTEDTVWRNDPLKSTQRIMILGDNPESGVIVNTAVNLGIYTVVVGINKDTLPKRIAHKSYDVNALDVDALVKIANEENITGVMVGVADVLVPSYCRLCDTLHLPCYASQESIKYLAHKSVFKEQLKKVGLPVIPEYQNMQIDKIPLPVVVKPVDSGGGAGISIVTDVAQLSEAISKATDCSHSHTIQIEKYMQGDIVACYYTIVDGVAYLSSLEDNLFTHKQGNLCPVTTGHIYASRYLDLYYQKAHAKICQLLKNIGVMNGILQINAFIEDDEFYFYDPGFRFQGEAQHHILSHVNGFDHKEMMVKFAFSGRMYDGDFSAVNDPRLHGRRCASIWVLLKEGSIDSIQGVDAIEADCRCVFNGQRFQEGQQVTPAMLGTEKQVFSRIYAACEDANDLRDFIKKIRDTLRVSDAAGNSLILDMMSAEDAY